jgi:hypothetical protein
MASPTPTKTPQPFSFKLVPFNYTLSKPDNGWQVGRVSIAFENATTSTIYPTITLQAELPNGIVVETREGITYTAQLILNNRDYYNSSASEKSLSLYTSQSGNPGPIPPGFRFNAIGDGTYGIEYHLIWKSAAAASPKRINFIDRPEMSFDLPSTQGSTISFPFDKLPSTISSFATLNGVDLVNDPKGIKATFTGKCGNLYYFDPKNTTPAYDSSNGIMRYLQVQVQNNDKFNEKSGQPIFAFTTFFRNGRMYVTQKAVYQGVMGMSKDGAASEIKLGPGQSNVGYIPLVWDAYNWDKTGKMPIMMSWTNTSYAIFDIEECVYVKPPR